jgi:hypothetical protein
MENDSPENILSDNSIIRILETLPRDVPSLIACFDHLSPILQAAAQHLVQLVLDTLNGVSYYSSSSQVDMSATSNSQASNRETLEKLFKEAGMF